MISGFLFFLLELFFSLWYIMLVILKFFLTEERMGKKFIYMFCEGAGSMRELLGGKGANLAQMTNLGMPVPNGFTITTEACTNYYENGERISPDIEAEIYAYLERLENESG